MRINLVNGNIEDQETDVIVNTTDTHILSRYGVCGAIVRAAGRKLEQEYHSKYPNGISYGDIAITRGGKLKCSYVYHVALRNTWKTDYASTVDDLQTVIKSCLSYADSSYQRSISFPLLGTGILQYARSEVIDQISAVARGYNALFLHTVNIVVGPTRGVKRINTDYEGMPKVKIPKAGLNYAYTSNEHEKQQSTSAGLIPQETKEIYDRAKGSARSSDQFSPYRNFMQDSASSPRVSQNDFHRNDSDEQKVKHLKEIFPNRSTSQLAEVAGSGDDMNAVINSLLDDIQYAECSSFGEKKISNDRTSPVIESTMSGSGCSPIVGSTMSDGGFSFNFGNKIPGRGSSPFVGTTTSDRGFSPIVGSTMSDRGFSPIVERTITDHESSDSFGSIISGHGSSSLVGSALSTSGSSHLVTTSSYGSWLPRKDNTSHTGSLYSVPSAAQSAACNFDPSKLEEQDDIMSEDEVLEDLDAPIELSDSEEHDGGNLMGYRELPVNWNPMKRSDDLKVVLIPTSDLEYREVANNFKRSLNKANIISIERIQNRTLYQQYQAMKTQFQNRNPCIQNEKELWHGTTENATTSINMHGFNRSYCGKNATVYGKGVYFATNASLSAHGVYSPKDHLGLKRIYQASVLTGQYTVGHSSYLVPPPKDDSMPHEL